MLESLIFDVDGTMADTEAAHLEAFNQAFEATGMPWRWTRELYTRLLHVTGGKERIAHYWRMTQSEVDVQNPEVVSQICRIHRIKTVAYERLVAAGEVQLRPGVQALIESAFREGFRLAIATTTSTANIVALLSRTLGPGWRSLFTVIEDASTAPSKKPHPMAYLQALARLRLAPYQCLAFEDSENGLRAARAAGLCVIVTPNDFTKQHDFQGAWRVLPNLEGLHLDVLQDMHANCPSFLARAA